MSFLAVLAGFCKLPHGLDWKVITGAGMLGGIGFTMSIFITLLAFDDPGLINATKAAVLVSSVVAGLLGFVFLHLSLKTVKVNE